MLYSLRARLILMFSVMLVVPLAAVVGIVTGVSTDVIGQLTRVSTSQTMDQYATYVNTLTDQAEEVAEQVLASDVAQQWIVTQEDRYERGLIGFEGNMELQQYLSMVSSNTSKIESVAVFLGERYGIWSFADDFLRSSWYAAYRDRGVRWTPSHFDKDQPSVSMRENALNSFISPLTHLDTLRNVGLIKVNLSTDEIRKPLDRLRLGESGRVYLLGGAGESVLGQDLKGHAAIVRLGLQTIRSKRGAGTDGYVRVRDDDRSYLLFYRELNASGWLLAGVVSEDELFSRITKIKRYVIFCSGGLLLLAVLAAFRLSSGVARPLSKLAASMKLAEVGDFDGAGSRLPPVKSRHSEVSYVVLMYARMINRLRSYIQLEVELNLRRRDAEYKALLLQINPHFLYNALETIGSLSAQGRNRDVQQVTEALGRMLRYSLKLDSDLTSLAEELKYVRHYTSILSRVYGDRLDVRIVDDTGGENAMIPKFILQPLVENACKFSLDHTFRAFVEIRAETFGDRLLLSVSDNGVGMELGQADRIAASSLALEDVNPLGSEGKRIGLRNVIARCRLQYGEAFGIRIESAPGLGTTVMLELPKGGMDDVPRSDR
ncbi:sensor histidine kinase [Cohnella sp. REN36]|uniref:cache domain-containing sensor histidine kinase n=1 Tax=Cohnella sp. REN36 TaxID=2887347 RepID=UPI001D155084|nr:sensor histidine kinase [Cohnella sp. REN36]MCC3375667.1 histidine kinase [Cohnella sp. REN36]